MTAPNPTSATPLAISSVPYSSEIYNSSTYSKDTTEEDKKLVKSCTCSSISNTPSVCTKPLAACEASSSTIFISIIAYRDSECQHTLSSAISLASFPQRLHFGVVWQYDPEIDAEHFDKLNWSSFQTNQLRQIFLHYTQARGPVYARALAQTLYAKEDFYLQIDSHMRFTPGWDVNLIQLLKKCPAKKPILTTYPYGYELGKPIPAITSPNLLCASRFDDADGFLRIYGRTFVCAANQPLNQYFWAAGFSFSSASVISEVPYDIHLQNVFFGEESSMCARLYTHGYDFFAPHFPIIFHLWTRHYRPTYFKDINREEKILKIQKLCGQHWVKFLLGQEQQYAPNVDEEFAIKQLGYQSLSQLRQDFASSSSTSSYAASASSSSSAILKQSNSDLSSPCGAFPLDVLLPPYLERCECCRLRFGRFGLGSQRSFQDFETCVGVDFSNRIISERSLFGGRQKEEFLLVHEEEQAVEEIVNALQPKNEKESVVQSEKKDEAKPEKQQDLHDAILKLALAVNRSKSKR